MDAEDINDELTSGIKAKQEYESLGSTAEELARKNKSVVSAPKTGFASLLDDLIVPASDTVGVRLLKKMGWREGHGIGPKRKKLKTHDQQEQKRVLGPSIPQEILTMRGNQYHPYVSLTRHLEQEDDEDEYATFAPKDVKSVEYEAKDDFYGIGYDPSSVAPEFHDRSKKNAPKADEVLTMSSVLKGPAATNRFGLGAFEDAEEPDVYDADSMDNYDRILLGEREAATAAKIEAQKKKKLEEEAAERSFKIDTNKCSDGSIPLRGFRISTRPLEKPKFWPAPTLPPNYKPVHHFDNSTDVPVATRHVVSAQQRGQILGETPLPVSNPTPSPATSVFDLLAPEDRKKLESLTGRFTSGTTETFSPEPSQQQLTEWEREKKEKDKVFAETAAKFKPLSNVMSSRFVKGTMQIGDRTVSAQQAKEEEYKSESYQEQAATMKMYGKLTRKVEDWLPAPLLCKRFNLKNPHQGKKPPEKEKKKPTEELLSGLDLPVNASEELQVKPPAESHVEAPQPQDVFEEDDTELNLPDKPSIDIFKAIFENDEDLEVKKQPETKKQEEEKTEPISMDTTIQQIDDQKQDLPDDSQAISIDPSNIDSILPSLEREAERSASESKRVMGPALPTSFSQPAPTPPASSIHTPSESPANPYLFVPAKRDTRGGPALAQQEEAKPIPLQPERSASTDKKRDARRDSSDSSDDDRSSKKRHKKEKKDKKSKKDKKHKKEKKHKRKYSSDSDSSEDDRHHYRSSKHRH
jgi:G patch domain-containing protein 1